jgi:hypothetical protein
VRAIFGEKVWENILAMKDFGGGKVVTVNGRKLIKV